MELQIRPATKAERMYTYSQSSQISGQCGLIGHLRADMGSDGKGFFSSWDDYRADLKTDDFKREFDEVINAMLFNSDYGGVLADRARLSHYCYDHPDSSFGNDREFGFRADTDRYAYLMRLNPNRGEYNLYCYCYRRDWLDQYLQQAERGIRFIDPNYKEKFRIPDGDSIKIQYAWGEDSIRQCRYIDDYHLEVGRDLYHIAEFAVRMEQNGHTCIPIRSSLPEQCYSTMPGTGEAIILKRGETGYYKTDIPFTSKEDVRELIDLYNRRLGVTPAQENAMQAGSMFGFEVPGADPANYDEHGQFTLTGADDPEPNEDEGITMGGM